MVDGKVFAWGARARETYLPRPVSKAVMEVYIVQGGVETVVEHAQGYVMVPVNRRARRKMFRLMNKGLFLDGYAPICMDSNDPETVKYGILKRLMRDVPSVKPEVLADIRKFVRAWCAAHLKRVRVLDFEEWLATTSYTEARKNELRLAYAMNRGGVPSKRVCSHVDSFVKSEFYPELKHCRMINSRCDRAKVFFGPRVKAIEEELYRLPQFVKHIPVPERPECVRKLKQAGRRYYQTDYTAFESHFVPEVMDVIECELYRYCLAGDEGVEFMCEVLKGVNRMRTRIGVRSQINGRRMSGDMNTSLGNGFSNYMLGLYLANRKGGTFDGIFEGDDGLFYSTVDLCAEDFASLGFTIKIEEVADPCCASFCGMIFSESGEIIRNPTKFMQGFAWTSSFIEGNQHLMDQLLRAKSLSAVYETPQCPIVGAMARLGLALTRGVTPRFVNDGYHVVVPNDESRLPEFAPSPDTRELFCQLYGISPANQVSIEGAIKRHDFSTLLAALPPPRDVEWYCTRYVGVQ